MQLAAAAQHSDSTHPAHCQLASGRQGCPPGWWLILASDHSVLAMLRAVNSCRRSTAAGQSGGGEQRGGDKWGGQFQMWRRTPSQITVDSRPSRRSSWRSVQPALTDQLLEAEELWGLHDLGVQVGRAPQVGQLVHRGGQAHGVKPLVLLRKQHGGEDMLGSMEDWRLRRWRAALHSAAASGMGSISERPREELISTAWQRK